MIAPKTWAEANAAKIDFTRAFVEGRETLAEMNQRILDHAEGEEPMTKKKSAKAETSKKRSKSKKNGAPKLREAVERKRYSMRLPVRASSKEIDGAAAAMAHEVRLQEGLRAEMKEASADFRGRKGDIEERMAELATTIEKGTKLEDVDVVDRLIVETNQVEVVRLDTGEVVETRAAKADERQESLFPDGGAQGGAGDPEGDLLPPLGHDDPDLEINDSAEA